MQGVYFYTAVAGFIVGIFCASLYPQILPYGLLSTLVSVGLLLIRRKRSSASFAPYLLCLIVFASTLSVGIFRTEYAQTRAAADPLIAQYNQKVTIHGTVAREVQVGAKSQQLFVQTGSSLVLVTVDRYAQVAYGDSVQVTGTIKKPEPFATDLGRTFDYEGYLAAKGVHATIPFAQIVIERHSNGYSIMSKLLLIKQFFMTHLEQVLSEPYVGLSEGLLLGVKQSLGTNLEDAFVKTGLVHIIVLSGYNIMLVVTFVMYLLQNLPMRLRRICGAITIVLFACMVGPSATVVRASCMALLGLLAQATGRTYTVLRALFVTGVLMLLYNPYLLVFDIGFQLSFMATIGLILFSPLIEQRVRFMPSFLHLREFLCATLATQITVTPMLLYQMGSFSVIAVITNLLVLPVVATAMFLTFITGLLASVSTVLALPVAFGAYLSLAYIIQTVSFFASLPFASVLVPAFPFYLVVIAYIGIVFLYSKLSSFTYSSARTIKSNEFSHWTIVDEEVFIASLSKKDIVPTPAFFK